MNTILIGVALFWFIVGAAVGGEWQLYWYRKNLVLTANGTGGVILSQLKISGNTLSSTQVNQNIVLQPSGTGTVQINTSNVPPLEKRQIAVALQGQIFTNDLAGEYNTIFFSMIKYILTEQKNLDWVFKTSFISVLHKIKELAQYSVFK